MSKLRLWSLVLLEHGDGMFYVLVLPLLASSSGENSWRSLLLAYGAYGISFFSRPLGALFWGKAGWAQAASHGQLFQWATFLGGVLGVLGAFMGHAQGWVWVIVFRFFRSFMLSCQVPLSKLFLARVSWTYHAVGMVGISVGSWLGSLRISEMTVWMILGLFPFLSSLLALGKIKKKEIAVSFPDPISLKKIFLLRKNESFFVLFSTALSQVTYLVPFILVPQILPLVLGYHPEIFQKWNCFLGLLDSALIVILGFYHTHHHGGLGRTPHELMSLSSRTLIWGAWFLPLGYGLSGFSQELFFLFFRVFLVFYGVIFLILQHQRYKEILPHGESLLILSWGQAWATALWGRMLPVGVLMPARAYPLETLSFVVSFTAFLAYRSLKLLENS